ncbi:hypothetical protein [Mycolicibacterium sphagni]|uniref:hypothetical protein n=1 Tax=Mycolicibacterium sphagni TaxID=1786 RepID=UPI0021F307BF|nr:hypothetical protein [Mycolicibacterium sphagni]MCV7177386.1 hypothetical protein [Mycolicibacterium sphagni]
MGLGQQGRYVGRVGALAVALGVGGLILALPAVASADTAGGDSGKATSSAGRPAPRNATGGRIAKPAAATPTGTLTVASRKPLAKVATDDPSAPATEAVSWTALGVTRRERSGVAGSARLITTGASGTTSSAASLVPGASTAPAAAGATASPVLNTAVLGFINHYLPGWNSIAGELAPIVADGIQDLISNGAISAEVQQLATNSTILQFISTKVSTAVTTYLGAPEAVSAVVGNAAANFVRNTLSNAGVQGALDVLANAVRPTEAQYTAITAGLATNNLEPLSDYLKSIVTGSSDELATFLSTPSVQAALASATSSAVVDLTSSAVIPTWLGDVVAGWVSDGLGGGAVAEGLGDALGNAVEGLLSNTKAMQGLGTVAGAAVTNLLSAPGVAAAVADAATAFGTQLLAGSNWVDALDVAWQGLVADSSFRAALGPAAGSAVYSLATNSDVVSALAAAASGLVSDVAGNPDVLAFLGEALGSTYGPTLVSTLSDPASAAQLAATVGSVVINFLGQAGVATALSTATDEVVSALLAGGDATDAVQSAVQALVNAPNVLAAFNATIPGALKGVLKAPAVQQVVSTVAQGVVAKLIDATPLSGSALAPAVSQVTKAAVDALVANPAAQNLISSLAGDILNGVPTGDLVDTVIQSVVNSPALQIALGQAVGQGFGALFGANPVGFAIGQLAGVAAALFFGFASGAAQLVGLPGAAAAAASRTGGSYLLVV